MDPTRPGAPDAPARSRVTARCQNAGMESYVTGGGLPTENELRERDRLAQLAGVFARHGMRGLGAWLGIGGFRGEDLASARPDAVVAMLCELGPVAVKFGQILATRSDLLAPDWVQALSTLQDRVPALPFDAIRILVEEAIGGPIDSLFACFDPEPLAAASIAQVHAATLLDGRRVIVKVRRPGIDRTVDADLRLLRRLARIAERHVPDIKRLKPDELLSHFAESLAREMDLSAEGRASDQIGGFVADLGVRTARFEWQLTGQQINVQERLEGTPATDMEAAQNKGTDLKRMARTYAQAVLRSIIFNGQFHADPHPGNVMFLDDGQLGFIDFGAVGTVLPRRREELVNLALAIATDDVPAVADILLIWAGDPPVDRRGLELALSRVIDSFSKAVLAQLELRSIFQQVFRLLQNFRLSLPPDLALVVRTLLTAEGFARRIDPGFDIGEALSPIARQIVAERLSPKGLKLEAKRLVAALGRAALSTPDIIRQLEKVARSGALPVSLDPRAMDQMRRSLRPEQSARAEILAGSLLISAAILAEPMPLLAGVSAAGAGGLLLLKWLRRRE
jgi:ubiquinone biosynthesis protein